MTKGLEALERLYTNYVHVFKARENGKTQLVHDLNTIKKELKALEIIKNKKVDVLSLLCGCSFEDYNRAHEEKGKLTQEEFDLLKEVLL